MADIFLSYVQEDGDVARELASGLEEAGYSVWYYERDSLPGYSYLEQILRVLDQARAVVVIISSATLGSPQVNIEITEAHTANKPFAPLLRDLSYATLISRRRPWTMMFGTAVAAPIPTEGVGVLMPRLVRGLQSLGVSAGEVVEEARTSSTRSARPVLPTPSPTPLTGEALAAILNPHHGLLDIARVVPFPADFGDRLSGLVWRRGWFYPVEREATYRVKDAERLTAEALRRDMIGAGWRQCYANYLGQADPDQPTHYAIAVESSATEYQSPEAASAMLAMIVGDRPGVTFPTIGDASVLRMHHGVSPEGKVFQEARLHFHVGQIVCTIRFRNFLDHPPELRLLEVVAQHVADRATVAAYRNRPPLGSMSLRIDFSLASGALDQSDRYQFCDSSSTAISGKDTDVYVHWHERYGVTDAFSASTWGTITPGWHRHVQARCQRAQQGDIKSRQIFAGFPNAPAITTLTTPGESLHVGADTSGAPDTQISVNFVLLAFPNETAAATAILDSRKSIISGWSQGGRTFLEALDAPILGDGSFTFTARETSATGQKPTNGFRMMARLGTTMVQMDALSSSGVTLDDMTGLVTMQLDCIAAYR